jgi:hypothetical protein
MSRKSHNPMIIIDLIMSALAFGLMDASIILFGVLIVPGVALLLIGIKNLD